MDDKDIEIQILTAALKVIHTELDSLISSCMTEEGKVKAPDIRDVMRAKGMLPSTYKNSFKPKEKKVKNG